MSEDIAKKPADGGVEARLARHGILSYLEIPTSDPARSAAFYESVLGWQVEWRNPGDARFDNTTGSLIGRWVTDRTAAREPGLLPYMYVGDIDGAIERVGKYGGEVVRGPDHEGNLRIATVRDPAGNLIGLWQQAV